MYLCSNLLLVFNLWKIMVFYVSDDIRINFWSSTNIFVIPLYYVQWLCCTSAHHPQSFSMFVNQWTNTIIRLLDMIIKLSNSKYDILFFDLPEITLHFVKSQIPLMGHSYMIHVRSIAPPTFFMKTFTLSILFIIIYLMCFLV